MPASSTTASSTRPAPSACPARPQRSAARRCCRGAARTVAQTPASPSRHLPPWQASIADADELLRDPHFRPQREALAAEQTRKRRLIAPLMAVPLEARQRALPVDAAGGDGAPGRRAAARHRWPPHCRQSGARGRGRRSTANRAVDVLEHFANQPHGFPRRTPEMEAAASRSHDAAEIASLEATVNQLAQQVQRLAIHGAEQRRMIAALREPWQTATARKVVPFPPAFRRTASRARSGSSPALLRA